MLLERIRAEKEQLIKDKKLKRDKKDNEPIDEIPFELPEGWEWCRLGEVCFFKGGYAFKSNKYIEKSNNQVIRIGNVKNNNLILSNQPVYVPDTLQNEIEDYHIKENDLLFTMTGTKGKRDYFYTLVVPKVRHNLYLNQRVGLLRVILSELNIYFINLVLKHRSVLDSIFQTETGNVNQGNIGSENTLNLLIPLPPLAEQHRIVQKIEQLFALVDTIETNQEALKILVKQAKNQVLSDAIAGKLTYQDPNDEPAEELLKRIGKTTTTAADTPYGKLPKGWAWCRLGDIGTINPKNKLNDELDVSFIPMTLISDGFSNVHTSEVKKWENVKKGYTHFCNEDIGIAKITPCFENRKSVIFNNLKNGVGVGTTELYILRNNKTLSFNKYIFWFIKTQEFINNGIKAFTGAVGQQRISRDFIENTLIPLPPLAEQHRIVEKIETYFSFLDIIESNL